jgi:hypothetical protein
VTRTTKDGWPVEAIFRFDRNLEDQALRWLRWNWNDAGGRFVSFRPPPIGETAHVQ